MLHSSWPAMAESHTCLGSYGPRLIGNTPTPRQPASCQITLHAQKQAQGGHLQELLTAATLIASSAWLVAAAKIVSLVASAWLGAAATAEVVPLVAAAWLVAAAPLGIASLVAASWLRAAAPSGAVSLVPLAPATPSAWGPSSRCAASPATFASSVARRWPLTSYYLDAITRAHSYIPGSWRPMPQTCDVAGFAVQLGGALGMQGALKTSDSSNIEREALWELHAEEYQRVSRCDLLSECRPEGKTLHCMTRQEGRMVATEVIMKGAWHGNQPFSRLDTSSTLCLKENLGNCNDRKDGQRSSNHSITSITLIELHSI